jgi:hypothetical protein
MDYCGSAGAMGTASLDDNRELADDFATGYARAVKPSQPEDKPDHAPLASAEASVVPPVIEED